MVHDLLPLSLGGVEGICHRLLDICMVACDVEEPRVVRGVRHPSRWGREVQVVPF
jgi:hypothetical protein